MGSMTVMSGPGLMMRSFLRISRWHVCLFITSVEVCISDLYLFRFLHHSSLPSALHILDISFSLSFFLSSSVSVSVIYNRSPRSYPSHRRHALLSALSHAIFGYGFAPHVGIRWQVGLSWTVWSCVSLLSKFSFVYRHVLPFMIRGCMYGLCFFCVFFGTYFSSSIQYVVHVLCL